MRDLILAIALVESGNNPEAIGDYEIGVPLAYGVLQIHECVVQDVNEYAGTSYTHSDAFDPEKSEEMFVIYMERYANEKRLEREPTYEDKARIWNGGPYGYKKPSTEIYWSKVKKQLEINNKLEKVLRKHLNGLVSGNTINQILNEKHSQDNRDSQ
jgi:hypothetical protein